ncbi:adenylate/guanylate cyclase domain-containing response regulator [Hymenobacter amundsenii]|uniref:Adenylate/guanylate cyclase domain-containing response regulator n=1 Tax=Hymenobacter amundsenii TaxID=2006685 RepID=A0A246FFR8_9BACT|nr:adenylate/guanylate cyclase domain-containing protein [Hymenobacter amundsenii]OWP61364.1 adenylate/guanylate cyclase domain-containing response regulator [Hymenobacter amundsenii]
MKTKILVVDDEADLELLIKQKFRRKIRENTYEFVFAGNGQQALDALGQHPDLDIVLSDINMPVMDGLELLSKLQEANPVLKTVMVSAYGDMPNIRTAMNRGAFDFVTKPVDFQDLELTIEKTAHHVQTLRQTLRAIQENNVLRMYVDETVLNFVGRPEFANTLMASETVEATVVFIDICGFTSLAEVLPPTEIVTMLNSYFDLMVKEIIAQGGYIDKFMGDAIMAVFRNEYHLDRAVDAALAARAALQSHHSILPDGKLYQPQVSIGINTGEMVSGNIGSASLKRLDYTVIGDNVNVSQRLQAVAVPGQVVITEATYLRLKESFQCRPLQEVVFKNKAEPVMIYEVVA